MCRCWVYMYRIQTICYIYSLKLTTCISRSQEVVIMRKQHMLQAVFLKEHAVNTKCRLGTTCLTCALFVMKVHCLHYMYTACTECTLLNVHYQYYMYIACTECTQDPVLHMHSLCCKHIVCSTCMLPVRHA